MLRRTMRTVTGHFQLPGSTGDVRGHRPVRQGDVRGHRPVRQGDVRGHRPVRQGDVQGHRPVRQGDVRGRTVHGATFEGAPVRRGDVQGHRPVRQGDVQGHRRVRRGDLQGRLVRRGDVQGRRTSAGAPRSSADGWIWMECNSLRRSGSRRMRAHLLAAGDDFQAGSGLMCAVRSFAWMTRTCLFRRCSPVPPWPLAARPGLQNSQGCSLFSEPTSQDSLWGTST